MLLAGAWITEKHFAATLRIKSNRIVWVKASESGDFSGIARALLLHDLIQLGPQFLE